MGRNLHSNLRPNQPAYVRLAKSQAWLPDDKTRPALQHPTLKTYQKPDGWKVGGVQDPDVECPYCNTETTWCKIHGLRSEGRHMEAAPMPKRNGTAPCLKGKKYDPKTADGKDCTEVLSIESF